MNTEQTINNVVNYYNTYDEQGRLANGTNEIEFVRTKEIISRYLPSPPSVILDVGGAAGRYACWLAKLGYTVHLLDPVPLHIEQALQASAKQPDHPISTCAIGDARRLEIDDNSADAVLLMGPLYHLTEQSDRLLALREAFRVIKPGGTLFTACISRFASTINGLASGFYLDPVFLGIMKKDLINGQHRNPTGNPKYFTDTFFHHPDELKAEVAEAGFSVDALLAIEGISALMNNLDESWQMPEHRAILLDILRRTETEPALMGVGSHLMCVGKKA